MFEEEEKKSVFLFKTCVRIRLAAMRMKHLDGREWVFFSCVGVTAIVKRAEKRQIIFIRIRRTFFSRSLEMQLSLELC